MTDHQVTDIAACTGTPSVFGGTSGTILSDLYDGVTEYPNNLNCQWKIDAPVGKVITLWFNVRVFEHPHLVDQFVNPSFNVSASM